jgi:tRNA threonylcarbamoyladenosine biosynthesis protein TsaB
MITILGIETSTAVCSIGLACLNDDTVGKAGVSNLLIERSIVESHIHSEKLLTLIREICENQDIALSKLDGVAISIGPGSFTGLRIGLSTAKGLCFSLAKPLITVPTFEAIAASVFISHPDFSRVIVFVDAKQGEYYRGAYEIANGMVREILPIQIQYISDVVAVNHGKTIVVTDRVDTVKKALDNSVSIEDIFIYCRGDVIANIAIKKLQTGEIDPLENLEPLYLKDFMIRSSGKMN